MTIQLLQGDCRTVLPTLPAGSVQMCVTSPPYYGLRSYLDASDPNKSREIGSELAPDCLAWARHEPPCGVCFVCTMREVFGLVRRVLREDGVVWVNIGDSYSGGGPHHGTKNTGKSGTNRGSITGTDRYLVDISEKNLLGVPWRVALALQADGWILRSDCIWQKPSAMPESVRDRPTRSHEYLFLFAKQARYFYDAEAIAEASSESSGWARQRANGINTWKYNDTDERVAQTGQRIESSTLGTPGKRNRRTVWSINTTPYPGSHYAVFPEKLVEIPILAGSSPRACEHCGAPWERVVERESFDRSGDRLYGGTLGHNPSGKVPGSNTRGMPQREQRDLGWRPTCRCADNTGAGRCVVLDPFCGTGTAMRVAEKYGRDSIGIDLGYQELSDKRTNGVQIHMEALL